MRISDMIKRLVLAALVGLFLVTPSVAQMMPDETGREILVKQNLLTFNDANLSGNYAVMRALSSKPFFDELTEEKLADLFKAFREQAIDIAAISVFPPVYTEDPVINADGLLHLTGYFDTQPSQVMFELDFYPDQGQWKIIAINVNVRPPDQTTK